MKIIKTQDMQPSSDEHNHWVYNGLDCCVTLEVFNVIHKQLDNVTASTYAFRRALQAPILEMNMRGILVDKEKRAAVLHDYERDLKILNEGLKEIVYEGLGLELNPNSPKQLLHLFYTVLRIPPVKKRNANGQYVPTVNREALERLDGYFIARPIVSHLLKIRDISKKVGVLRTEIDADNRMRTSYNICGTNTGRLSSSLSEFGTGTNLQNIEERLRSVFVADTGKKLAYIDGSQAESRVCGAIHWNLFNDGRYLDACESGDLHTSVCKLAWSNLPWAGTLKEDKAIAEQPFYRQHSYRHMAKVLGHGSNYGGQPVTMSKHTKLEASIIKEFQAKYFKAFPAFKQWHDWVAAQIYTKGQLTTMLGMRRDFFGRRNDPSTIRQAIACEPQSTVGELINYGMLEVWRLNICDIVLQVHDAIVIQYEEERENEIIPKVLEAFQRPIELKRGRILIIPSETKVGWNWAPGSEKNLDGMKLYNGNDTRKRAEKSSILARRLSGIH